MDLRSAPLLLPAAALTFGSLLSFYLPFLSIPLLVLLGLAGLALQSRAGWALAFAAAGLLAASLDRSRSQPVGSGLLQIEAAEVIVRVASFWSREEEGWAATCRGLGLRQRGDLATGEFELIVHLPGVEPPPPYGSTLRLRGTLSRSPGFANSAPVPPGPWRLWLKSRVLMEVAAPPGRTARLVHRLRREAERAFAAGPESPGKILARALVLGDAAALPKPWRRALQVTGLAHLTSVSGVHVSLVMGLVWLLAARLPRPLRLGLAFASILCYLAVAGPLPALVRASVMGVLAILALAAERPPAAANALAWAVIGLVLHRPGVVQEPSFQLSVAATAGLLLLAPALTRSWSSRWPRCPLWILQPLALSAAAQLCTLPLALPLFHWLSAVSPLANLLAAPWAAVTLVASLGWAGLAAIHPGAAAWALPALDLLARPLDGLAALYPARWSGWPCLIPAPAALVLASAVTFLLLRPGRRALLAAVLLFAGFALWERGEERDVEMIVFDVGQGDAILLRDGSRAVLVDGGGWRRGDFGGRVLLPALLAEGVRALDAVVMSHPDLDHCGGLADLTAWLRVGEVWTAPGWKAEGCVAELFSVPGIPVRERAAGDTATVGRWRLDFLHPEAVPRGEEDNERSLVVRAAALGRSALLTGDVESWGERRMLAAGAELRSDVLKVAHHGSRSSSGEELLRAASPRLALVSAGRGNRFHHPSPEVVERLAELSIPLLRTDRDGEIRLRFEADGGLRLDLPGSPR